MRKWRWLLFLLPPLFFTGCWDAKDPEDRSFISILGVDDAAEGCTFTFAPANIENGEAEIVTAATLAEAVAEVDTRISRKTDLGQLKTVILSQSFLEQAEKRESLLRELEQSQAVSAKVMLLATTDTASACVTAALAEDRGLFLWDFYKNTAAEVAVTKGMDLDTFLAEQAEQGGNAVLPRISTENDRLRLGGGVALSLNLVLPLNAEEERGYLFLLGEAEGAVLSPVDEKIPLRIEKNRVRYTFSEQKDGILCSIEIFAEGIPQGLYAEAEWRNPFAALIQSEAAHTLAIAQTAGTDLFGILPRLYRQAPELAEGYSREEVWAAMQFEISVSLQEKR